MENNLIEDPQPHPNSKEWFSRYGEYLHRFPLERVNEQQADDLVQDTFLSGLEQLNRFNNKSLKRHGSPVFLNSKFSRFIDAAQIKSSNSSISTLNDKKKPSKPLAC